MRQLHVYLIYYYWKSRIESYQFGRDTQPFLDNVCEGEMLLM